MEAIKKQARQFREQVAKQQQAVIKQFSGRYGIETAVAEEADRQCHQKLRELYDSTRSAKHFQKNIVRGVEGLISVNLKQLEIYKKLAEDCCKYGSENEGLALPHAAMQFGNSHKFIEKERENLLKVLGDQVYEKLRAMILSAPLEDARQLTYQYERIRHDVESQAIEVVKRRFKTRETNANEETSTKLQHAEARLSELNTTMQVLGREATAAMSLVQDQQQQVTFQKLLAMVEAERSYHRNAASILDQLYSEMVQAKQHAELSSEMSSNTADVTESLSLPAQPNGNASSLTSPERSQAESSLETTDNVIDEDTVAKIAKSNGKHEPSAIAQKKEYFIAEVVHPFDAQADGELGLSVGDYVVVRQVCESGWSEGECKGNAGWFPSAYVVQREKAPASKVIEEKQPV